MVNVSLRIIKEIGKTTSEIASRATERAISGRGPERETDA
jgi:hypothetical protein